MDLLGSILNSMDKPPSVSDKQKDLLKKQRAELLKKQKEDKEKLKLFRRKVEYKINKFLKDGKLLRCAFEPMDQVYRSIIHDVAEVGGMTAYSFGEEGVDRYIEVYKPEGVPCDEELSALRRGEIWDPVKAKQEAREREQEEKEARTRNTSKKEFIPNSNYKEKYEHLIGKESALDAARKTETNKQYGFVPSSNKKDCRSIEQTLADIQTKKRLKIAHNTSTLSSATNENKNTSAKPSSTSSITPTTTTTSN